MVIYAVIEIFECSHFIANSNHRASERNSKIIFRMMFERRTNFLGIQVYHFDCKFEKILYFYLSD